MKGSVISAGDHRGTTELQPGSGLHATLILVPVTTAILFFDRSFAQLSVHL